MRKIILAAILAATAFGGNFEQAAKMYLKKSDFENGARLFEKSCNDDKNAAGCYMAAFLGEQGVFYDNEGGGEKVFALYKKACEGGVGEACARAAAHHSGEYGGTKDPQKVRKYYSLACDHKDSQGCYMLAQGYEKAGQDDKDVKKAMDLYGLACDYGYTEGCVKFRELVKKAK